MNSEPSFFFFFFLQGSNLCQVSASVDPYGPATYTNISFLLSLRKTKLCKIICELHVKRLTGVTTQVMDYVVCTCRPIYNKPHVKMENNLE